MVDKAKELKKCPECDEVFVWNDDVVFVEGVDTLYHEDCVDVFPIRWFATDNNGEPLGDVELTGEMPHDHLTAGEYIDTGSTDRYTCPECGSPSVKTFSDYESTFKKCGHCEHIFEVLHDY